MTEAEQIEKLQKLVTKLTLAAYKKVTELKGELKYAEEEILRLEKENKKLKLIIANELDRPIYILTPN